MGTLSATAAITSRSRPSAKPVWATRSPPNSSARLYEPSQIIEPLFAGPSEDVGSLVENREIPRETDKLPERLREIASPESPEFRVQHGEVPFVEGMQDDGLVRGSERKVVA